jgi:hypothetical protein
VREQLWRARRPAARNAGARRADRRHPARGSTVSGARDRPRPAARNRPRSTHVRQADGQPLGDALRCTAFVRRPSRRSRRLLALLALLAFAAVPAGAGAQAPTAASLQGEVTGLLDATAVQWAELVTPTAVFQNPFAADVAIGHHSFVPPLLAYSLHRAGQRNGDRRLVSAAERTWPHVVLPANASSFDMLGAAYAYQTLTLSDARRRQLAAYMADYDIPVTGRRCLLRPRCWGNLKLVDALAVLAITGAGIRSPNPVARLGDPVAARAAATRIVNRRLAQVADHGLRAEIGDARVRGTVLSDPPADPLAYHALSAFMINEAVAQLGAAASPAARRVQREALDALSVLISPDGDTSYLGRGQGQVWIPALAAGAFASGARTMLSAGQPGRATRYLAGAQRAVRRLVALHAGPYGLQVVPGALTRTTTAGIDGYAHTVAYNGLALFGLTRALDALAALPPAAPIGRLPADGPLAVRDQRATGLGVVASRRIWLAVHKTPTNANDLRHDFGALALKRRTAGGWIDLLAPRPLTITTLDSGGPAMMYEGRPVTPTGFGIHVGRSRVVVNGAYRVDNRIVRRVRFTWRLTRRGVRLRVSGARAGDRFRMLAWTPAGTGGRAGRRRLLAAGARWRFSRPIRTRRITGFHSGPVEQLDAIEARLRLRGTEQFAIRIGI